MSDCLHNNRCQKLYLILEILFIALSIVTTVFSFFINSNINKIKDLKIKTSFKPLLNNNTDWLLNYLDDEFENNKTNKYEEFFDKYNLKEGQSFSKNEKIKDSLDKIYKISLSIAIISIIIIFFIIVVLLILNVFCNDEDDEDLNSWLMNSFCSLIFSEIIRSIILIILLGIFVGFFVNYKNGFEYDFFDFYNNINNNSEQTSFKKYYYALFDLKTYFIIGIIPLPMNILLSIGLFIYNVMSF